MEATSHFTTIITAFTSSFADLQASALDLLSKSVPYIVVIVGAGVVIALGIKVVKKFKAA